MIVDIANLGSSEIRLRLVLLCDFLSPPFDRCLNFKHHGKTDQEYESGILRLAHRILNCIWELMNM